VARIVLTTFGSWGDLFPLLGLGHELAARGHTPVYAITPAGEDLVRGEGFEFAPVGPRFGWEEYRDHLAILDGRLRGVASLFTIMRRIAMPNLDGAVDDLRNALDGADLVLTHPVQLAGPIAAEAAGVPWATVSVFPGLLPTAHFPPQFVPWSPPGALGRVANRASWAAGRVVTYSLFNRGINAARRRVGLAPLRQAFIEQSASPRGVVVLCSGEYEPIAPDWPTNVAMTGFVRFDQPAALGMPDDVAAFLQAGPPPVVVTLGASLSLDPGTFWDDAAAVLDELGQRAVFLVAQDEHRIGALAGRDGVWAYAPLSAVLPHARAVVHHGGFGTMVETIHAGIPSVSVPRAFDQVHHADRLRALGVGTTIPWHRVSQRRLRDALRDVLGSSAMATRAKELAVTLQAEDGTRRAGDVVAALLDDDHSSWSPTSTSAS
jgi:UDP:flavonoid glycosyltransferase YjiC (YdhE family)